MNKIIKIMVVDDSLIVRNILRETFDFEGFKVVAEAINGADAIQKYNQYHPDIVTMDLIMPVMNGLEASEKILKQHPNAKIVIVSAVEDKEIIDEAIKLGVKDFIIKPFDLIELRNKIKKIAF